MLTGVAEKQAKGLSQYLGYIESVKCNIYGETLRLNAAIDGMNEILSGQNLSDYIHASVLHHEIRNPLNVIKGFAEIAIEEIKESSPPSSQIEEYLQRILSVTQDLEKLCDNNFSMLQVKHQSESQS